MFVNNFWQNSTKFWRKHVILEQCERVHFVDLGESFQTHIFLQNFSSIQPRTSPLKFARSLAMQQPLVERAHPTAADWGPEPRQADRAEHRARELPVPQPPLQAAGAELTTRGDRLLVSANFERLVLGCMDSYDSEIRRNFAAFFATYKMYLLDLISIQFCTAFFKIYQIL